MVKISLNPTDKKIFKIFNDKFLKSLSDQIYEKSSLDLKGKLENIKSYLEKNLVRYKIPKDYFILDELPKNIMGKVQKNILKKKYNKN